METILSRSPHPSPSLPPHPPTHSTICLHSNKFTIPTTDGSAIATHTLLNSSMAAAAAAVVVCSFSGAGSAVGFTSLVCPAGYVGQQGWLLRSSNAYAAPQFCVIASPKRSIHSECPRLSCHATDAAGRSQAETNDNSQGVELDGSSKRTSILCSNCEGNGAMLCSQCKGSGINSVNHFGERFKAGTTCWLCRGKREMLCGDCNGAGFLGGYLSSFED